MSGAIGALGTALANPPSAQPGYWQQGINNLTTLKDYQARNALQQIYQDPTVVDPNTGAVDQGRLNALISQSPQASWNAAPAMQAQGQAATAQGQGVQEQMAAHRARMTQMLGIMNGLVAKGGPISGTDVMNAANQGHFSPGEMTQLAQDMNTTNPGNDPSFDWSNWVKGHMASNLSAQEQINRVTPQMQMISTPQGIVATDVNPNTTRTPPGTAFPAGLAPGEQIWDPNAYGPGQGGYRKAGGVVAPGATTGAPGAVAPAAGGAAAGSAPTIARDPSVPIAGAQANNPGNLMFAGQPGASQLPLSGGRVLAAFPNMPTGIAANANQLLINQDQHGINTVRGMVKQWVLGPNPDPKAPQPNLTSYTNDTAKALGVDPDAPVNFHDPAVLQKFIMAQQPHETGGRGGITLNPADVTSGVNMALGRGTQVAGPGAGPAPQAPQAVTATPLPAPAPRPAPVPAAPAGPLAGPPAGYEQNIEANQKAYQADAAAVPRHQDNINNLQKAYQALTLANTGPSTSRVHNALAFLQAQGFPLTAGMDERTTSWAEAAKYLIGYAQQQGIAAGGTDMQAALSQAANASVDIPKDAALAVTANNIGRERMAIAQVQGAPDKTGADYLTKYVPTFAPSQDIRAYSADLMTPAQIKQLQQERAANSPAYQKFVASLEFAVTHGLITKEALAQANKKLQANP